MSAPEAAEDRNAHVFDGRWSASRRVTRVRPHVWRELRARIGDGEVLEIGPGLRPTVQVQGSHFAEISGEAVATLRAMGGLAHRYAGGPLPLRDGQVRAVCAFEVLEHVPDDEALLREIVRVLAPNGLFVFSVPVHQRLWTTLDDVAAHVRRYEPDELFDKLARAGFEIEKVELSRRRSPRALIEAGMAVRRLAPRLADGFVSSVVFPAHATFERWFARTAWRDPGTPVAEDVSGIRVMARKAAPSG